MGGGGGVGGATIAGGGIIAGGGKIGGGVTDGGAGAPSVSAAPPLRAVRPVESRGDPTPAGALGEAIGAGGGQPDSITLRLGSMRFSSAFTLPGGGCCEYTTLPFASLHFQTLTASADAVLAAAPSPVRTETRRTDKRRIGGRMGKPLPRDYLKTDVTS